MNKLKLMKRFRDLRHTINHSIHTPLKTAIFGLPISLNIGSLCLLRLVFSALIELWYLFWARHDLGPHLKHVAVFLNLATFPLLAGIAVGIIGAAILLLGFTLDLAVTAICDSVSTLEKGYEFLQRSPEIILQADPVKVEAPWMGNLGRGSEIPNPKDSLIAPFHDEWKVGADEVSTHPHNSPVQVLQTHEPKPSPAHDFLLSPFLKPNERILVPTTQTTNLSQRSTSATMLRASKEKHRRTDSKRFGRTFSADDSDRPFRKNSKASDEFARRNVTVADMERRQENEPPIVVGKIRYVDRSMAEIKEVDLSGHETEPNTPMDEYDRVLSRYVSSEEH